MTTPNEPRATPAVEDPNRDRSGKFVRGNLTARTHGLWQRCGLGRNEKRQAGRIRKYLLEAGVPGEVAANLSLQWAGAGRIIEAFFAIDDPRERLEMTGVFERACAIQRAVLRRRDRELGRDVAVEPPADIAELLGEVGE